MYSRDVQKNLAHLIKTSVGVDLFSRLYVTDRDGDELEVTESGQLSCALFASSLLSLVGRIDHPHATVTSTIKAMTDSGKWSVTDDPRAGDVIEWGVGEAGHSHIGFVLGDNLAVSNSEAQRQPVQHDFVMSDGRAPVRFWRYTSEANSLHQHKSKELKGTYRHNKSGRLYQLIGTAFHTETEENLVVYQPLYDSEHELFARPFEMFFEQVVIGGRQVPRFEKINN